MQYDIIALPKDRWKGTAIPMTVRNGSYFRSLNTNTVSVQDDPDLAGQISITISHILRA